jgi:hypothetical protein
MLEMRMAKDFPSQYNPILEHCFHDRKKLEKVKNGH